MMDELQHLRCETAHFSTAELFAICSLTLSDVGI